MLFFAGDGTYIKACCLRMIRNSAARALTSERGSLSNILMMVNRCISEQSDYGVVPRLVELNGNCAADIIAGIWKKRQCFVLKDYSAINFIIDLFCQAGRNLFTRRNVE